GFTTAPAGSGYATISVTKSGQVKVLGALADGTKLSQSTSLSADGTWPMYIPLYGGGGSVMSWNCFPRRAKRDLVGCLTWIKEPSSKSKNYPGGFTTQMAIIGSAYNPPASGSPIPAITIGDLTLGGGNLEKSVINQITIDSKGHVKS